MTIETELPAVKVRELEWQSDFSHTPFGLFYMISDYNGGAILEKIEGSSTTKSAWPSRQVAKDAAQGDYERRIRSALVPSTPAELVTREDLCQFIRDKAEGHKGMLQDDFWPFLTMYLLDNFSIQRSALKELGKGDGR